MKMAVITKKDEKIQATVDALNQGFSPEQFIEKFKELFPKD